MAWIDEALDLLAVATPGGYHAGAAAATEPTALAALALTAHGRLGAAARALGWLADRQAADGSLGVTAELTSPNWPTSLAIAAWKFAGQDRYAAAMERGVQWLLTLQGKTLQPDDALGHDVTLVGWPWVAETHSWQEPTALAVLALKAAGRGDHARSREGVRLLRDRLLPDGGSNYGNTLVMGQPLRPHPQSTGLSLVALQGEEDDGRIAKSLGYLRGELNGSTATASLSWGLLGLTAHGPTPLAAATWLHAAWQRTRRRDPATYKLALLALAALGRECPFIQLQNLTTATA